MKPAAKRSTLSWVQSLIAVAACAALPGCSETRHYHAARPTEAVLEIRVGNQWQMIKRERYLYEKPMDDWQSLPVAELERMLRERESRGDFGPETTALRVWIETRKAGVNLKEK